MAKPYTLIHGPWLPDLQNVGVQMGYQWSGTEIPTADCDKVYWADASYRSLPGPYSIGPTLGTPITNAFTWFDNSTGKEEIFAATANGLSMLVDGVWTAVPVQSNASSQLIGQAIAISLGTIAPLSLYVSPNTQSVSQAGTSYTFTCSAVTVGTPSAHTWSLSAPVGGTWSIVSGQGTSSVQVQITGAPTGGGTDSVTVVCNATINGHSLTADASLLYANTQPSTYTGTLVAGDLGGTIDGYLPQSSVGSLSPTSDPQGHTIADLFYTVSSGLLQLDFSGFTSDPGVNYFTRLQISSSIYTPSSYSYSGGTATWKWSTTDQFASGNSYTITITY